MNSIIIMGKESRGSSEKDNSDQEGFGGGVFMSEDGEVLGRGMVMSDNFIVDSYINGSFVPPTPGTMYMGIQNPATGEDVGMVCMSDQGTVDQAVRAAQAAHANWAQNFTMKARAAIMLKFHALVQANAEMLAESIVRENGKNITEAMADVAKGAETIEYAACIPNSVTGKKMKVSSDVYCEDHRQSLGVVVSIVPFNFPFMVPMWTIPIALMMGNCVILKPSEKVPITMSIAARLLEHAGLPSGVFQMVQGDATVVNALIQHDGVKAVTFVGSSPVAKHVATSCRALNKRCTALGGAKNHLIALTANCDISSTASDVVVSFAGCAGQRCMAASVLLVCPTASPGEVANSAPSGAETLLLDKIVELASKIEPGTGPKQMGPVIDEAAYKRICTYIKAAEKDKKCKILLDGRPWGEKAKKAVENGGEGNWIGPTIILHESKDDRTMREEVFGPVLSVYRCSSWEEAIAIENRNEFGNAAAIYTTHGGHGDWFTSRFRKAAMIGINIGIPVPREPFSFGGLYGTCSKYGDMDITGDGAIEFFSNRIKITSKWPMSSPASSVPPNQGAAGQDGKSVDHANFAGSM
jgi:malonate-semialdehyde dehydrogenase (acetylating) / methylmalonate-semialdehyde dehydrogenase